MSRIVYTPRETRIKKGSFHIFSRKASNVFLACLVFFLASAAGVYALRLPQWQVKKIEFRGLQMLDERELEGKTQTLLDGNYGYVIPRRSMLAVFPKRLAATLQKEFPRIERADVMKRFPDSLFIAVVERAMWGVFCADTPEQDGSSCAYIDKTGFAYETSPRSSGSLITKIKSDVSDVAVGSFVVEKELMELFLFVGQEVKRVAGSDVVAYEISSRAPREIRLALSDGYQLYMNRSDDFQNVFTVLRRVLDQEIKDKRARLEYIDLRFGNKVFYRFQ